MNAEQNKKLVMEGYKRFQNKDIEGVLARFSDDVDCVAPDLDCAPFAGSFHGKNEVRKFFAQLDAAQEATRFEPAAFIAEGDKVAVTGSATWRVKSTGIAYDSEWAHVFTVRDGQIVRIQQYLDTAAAEHALRPAAGAQAPHPELRH